MIGTVVRIPGDRIVDIHSFHEVLAEALGFPDFYGANFNALIDCLWSVDDPLAGMVNPSVAAGELLLLQINNADLFKARRPSEYGALLEIVAFVNHERTAAGGSPVLGLILVGDLDD